MVFLRQTEASMMPPDGSIRSRLAARRPSVPDRRVMIDPGAGDGLRK